MRAVSAVRVFSISVAILFLCSQAPAQSALCVHDLFCLFNQEAAASSPAGIHKYSDDLIGLLALPDTGKSYTNSLANRLAKAEQMARTGKGKLVPEANVALAFNELMKKVGASPAFMTDADSVWSFREYAASHNAFPALFSAKHNGTNCNPGEAVFLLYLLITNNGVLSNQELNLAQSLMRINAQPNVRRYAIAGMVPSMGATKFIYSYANTHSGDADIALFNHTAKILGF